MVEKGKKSFFDLIIVHCILTSDMLYCTHIEGEKHRF